MSSPKLLLQWILLLFLAAVGADRSGAQGITVLHDFAGSDGCSPVYDLTSDGSTLYGVVPYDTVNGNGYIYTLNSDGTGFSLLYGFSNSTGRAPEGGLLVSGGSLYGATSAGGASSVGTVFKVSTNGTGYTVLHDFSGSYILYPGGSYPYGGLIMVDGELYGSTYRGGISNYGVIFKIGTNGNNFTVLKEFTGSDGENPENRLATDGTYLYGATASSYSGGVIFKLKKDGSGFSVLKSFSELQLAASGPSTNLDGYNPRTGVILSGNMLYGTTFAGGTKGFGCVFKIGTDGNGFAIVKDFDPAADGANPVSLVLDGSRLVGAAANGGANNRGTLFSLGTDGSGFTVLQTFAANPDGTNHGGVTPGGLSVLNGILYGVASAGGSNGCGTVFTIPQDISQSRPAISTQPISVTNIVGTASSFTVAATGTPPLFYQWTRDGVSLPGATNAVLSLENVEIASEGIYAVTIANAYGNVTSTPATLLIVTNFSIPALTFYPTRSPTNYWTALAASADGQTLIAANDTYYPHTGTISISTNFGGTWRVTSAPEQNWQFLACSSNAQIIIAGINNDYLPLTPFSLYLSIDGGATWTQTGPAENWNSVAISSDGSRIVAVSYNPSLVCISADSGQHWSTNFSFSDDYLWSVASSADGNVLFLGSLDGNIYRSTDGGATWVDLNVGYFGLRWKGLACSTDGYIVIGFDEWQGIYRSIDGGDSWSQTDSAQFNLSSVAGSASGSRWIAAGRPTLETSSDYGASWTVIGSSSVWKGGVMSANGDHVAAAAYGNYLSRPEVIYISDLNAIPFIGDPPSITNQPLSLTNLVGTTATFTVSVTNAPPLIYQWVRDGVSLPGATNAMLSLDNVQIASEGIYAVIITNVWGGITSSPATLLVVTNFPPPVPAWYPTSSPSNYWTAIAGSADGQKLVAVSEKLVLGDGRMYISTNFGASWYATPIPSQDWEFVACSSNAQIIVAGGRVEFDAPTSLFVSTDGGITWTQSAPSANWTAASMSADGSKIIATCESPGQIYISNDSGQHWSLSASFDDSSFSCSASSANGDVLFAASINGDIYRSTDGGESWVVLHSGSPYIELNAIACSADGYVLVGSGNFASVYRSINRGDTWIQADIIIPRPGAIACSASGSRWVVAGGPYIAISVDYGGSWTVTDSLQVRRWSGVVSTANGDRLALLAHDDFDGGIPEVIYTSSFVASATNDVSACSAMPVHLIDWTLDLQTNVMTLSGAPNCSYVLQYSTNLAVGSWTSLSTNASDANGLWTVMDNPPGNQLRFYRCIAPR